MPRTSRRALLSVLLLAAPAAAQLSTPGTPPGLRHARLLAADVPARVLPRPDLERLQREDEERNHWPLRYGAVVPVAFGCDDAGRWDELPSGELVWRVRVVSPGARSLGVLFDRFELPPSGELYLYDPGQATVLGAFTAATRQPNGMLAVQPVLGDEVVIEYAQAGSDPGRPVLRLGEVVHDYRGVLDRVQAEAPQQLAAGCLVDVNCPAGAAYQDIKRSVMFVLFGGIYCTAALLDDTARDGTPYFLTANHCGDMTNVVAVFGYENPGCGSGGASQSQTVSGATRLATSTTYDSQLYLLSSAPPAAFEPFYAGWDRGRSQPAPGISISHPNGLPRKLARDDDTPILSGLDFRATWEIGKLEPGSSGSPLFNGAKRVIGPACCVSDFTCNGQWGIYGRFGGFYDQRNLGQWLDPLGLDPERIDGHDPSQGIAIAYNGAGGNPEVYRSATPPTLGTTWVAEVDTSSLPFQVNTVILGYAQPLAGLFVSQGEVLVDIGQPLVFSSIAPAVGGLATHSSPLPNNPALVGLSAFTQAVLLVNGAPLLLTNGLELRLR